MGFFTIKIPEVSSSTEIARRTPSEVVKKVPQWRLAKHMRQGKHDVSALELTVETAILAVRLLNVPWISEGDYLVSYRDSSIRAFKKSNFDDTYYFTEED